MRIMSIKFERQTEMTEDRGTLGVVGFGSMAEAIVKAALNAGEFSRGGVYIFDPAAERRELAGSMGLNVFTSETGVWESAEIILLAVKPQNIDEVVEKCKGINIIGKCIVSILAGVSAKYLREKFCGCHVVQVMPNTPILCGQGAAAMTYSGDIPERYRDKAMRMFSSAGLVKLLPEDKMNEVVSINGSSPAYFFTLIKAMAEYGVSAGIDYGTALLLAAQSMKGAAEMLLTLSDAAATAAGGEAAGGRSPAQLIAQVTSKGGTTFAALEAMEQAGFSESVRLGMEACTKRAREIGR
jgi:pyrroline-5-carboxylate reductase